MADLVKRLRAVLDLDPDQFAATATEAADAIEELMAGIGAYLALLERSLDVGPHTNNPSREVKRLNHLRALLSKYGADNG